MIFALSLLVIALALLWLASSRRGLGVVSMLALAWLLCLPLVPAEAACGNRGSRIIHRLLHPFSRVRQRSVNVSHVRARSVTSCSNGACSR